MIGYLTEQESNTVDERSMRSEVIETMTALQNTVETLSSVSIDFEFFLAFH